MEMEENVTKLLENAINVKLGEEVMSVRKIVIRDVTFLKIIADKMTENVVAKVDILVIHVMGNVIDIVKIVIKLMGHVMNVSLDIILILRTKNNVLNVLKIVMGNALKEYVRNAKIVFMVIFVIKIVQKIV